MWTALCTVSDVSEGPAPINVTLGATDTQITGTDDDTHVSSVVVNLVIDADETHLKVGDAVTVEANC